MWTWKGFTVIGRKQNSPIFVIQFTLKVLGLLCFLEWASPVTTVIRVRLGLKQINAHIVWVSYISLLVHLML